MKQAIFRGTYTSSGTTKIHYAVVEDGSTIGDVLVEVGSEIVVTSEQLDQATLADFEVAYGEIADENYTGSFTFGAEAPVEPEPEPEPPAE